MGNPVVKGQARTRNRQKKQQLARHGVQWDGDKVNYHIDNPFIGH